MNSWFSLDLMADIWPSWNLPLHELMLMYSYIRYVWKSQVGGCCYKIGIQRKLKWSLFYKSFSVLGGTQLHVYIYSYLSITTHSNWGGSEYQHNFKVREVHNSAWMLPLEICFKSRKCTEVHTWMWRKFLSPRSAWKCISAAIRNLSRVPKVHRSAWILHL